LSAVTVGARAGTGGRGSMTDSKERSLPTPCPECGAELETRDDAIVHMVMHA